MLQFECLPDDRAKAEALARFNGAPLSDRAPNPIPGLRGRIHRAGGTIGEASGVIRMRVGQQDGGGTQPWQRDRANPRRSPA